MKVQVQIFFPGLHKIIEQVQITRIDARVASVGKRKLGKFSFIGVICFFPLLQVARSKSTANYNNYCGLTIMHGVMASCGSKSNMRM